MKCYLYNGVLLNEKLLIEEIIKELDTNSELKNLANYVYKAKSLKEKFDELAEKNKKYIKDPEYCAVTKFIPAPHPGFGQLSPEVNITTRKTLYIKDHLVDFNNDPKLAEIAFDELIYHEKENTKVGTYVHEFTNILLTKGERSSEYLLALDKLKIDLTKNDFAFAKSITADEDSKSGIKYDDISAIVKKITDQAVDIKNWINRLFPESNRAGLYSELPLVLQKTNLTHLACVINGETKDFSGLVGIADLVILDKDGTVHLVDYKVSCRPYSLWYLAKLNEVDYQLAIYRAMLSNIVDPTKITLHVKPMVMKKLKISSLESETKITGQESIDILDSGAGGASRVSLTGSFTAKLIQLGIGAQIEIGTVNDSELHSKVEEDWGKIMGYHADPKELSKENFINREYLKPIIGNNGEYLGWKFFNRLTNKIVKSDNKEDFTKENGLIDQYLQQLKVDKNEILRTIVKLIKELKKNPTKNFTFLRSDKFPERAEALNNVLGRYISNNWEYVGDNIPEFAEHGILLFLKITEQGSIFEAVALSDIDLETKVLINEHNNLLGKYYSDKEANHLEIKPLDSSYKNIKALEVVSVLNTIANNHSEVFKDIALNQIVVLNPAYGSHVYITPSVLQDNFRELCKKANLKNAFDSADSGIKTTPVYESIMSELLRVLSQLEEDSQLGTLLTKLDGTQVTLAKKREAVYSILTKMRHTFPQLAKIKDFESKRIYETNDPVINSYLLLSLMYNFLNGVSITYEGKISKWGANFSEALLLLGLPLFDTLSKTDNQGYKMVGIFGGLKMTSPRTTPSSTLQQLFTAYDIAFNSVSKEFMREVSYIEEISKDYIYNKSNNLKQLISAGNVKVWERLLVHDSTGKVAPELRIKNPWTSTDITETDKQFLKEILWEMNKYLLPGITEDLLKLHYKGNENIIDNLDSVLNAKSEGTYFLLPLKRADDHQKRVTVLDFGLKKYFKAKIKELQDNYDPRQLHQERAKQLSNRDHTEMYNEYNITESERQYLLEKVDNPYYFSFDLDFLAADIAFLNIRKYHFDRALMLTETTMAIMHLKQLEEGVDMSNEIKTGSTQSKISLSGDSILDEDLHDLAKGAGLLKRVNSAILLSFRLPLFLKELTFGLFTNFSRAWALKYGSNAFSLGNVAKANKIIWGQELGKYGNAFIGKGSLADFTMCEQINLLYRIANLDLNRIVENATIQRVGIANNFSRWMYIANSAPDYFNRLTLFISKMLADGCFDAHTLDENGQIHYDWKKDKRFSILAKLGLNSDSKDKLFLKEKALYMAMCEEFEKGGEELLIWDKETKKYILKDITQAYTPSQRASIKEVSDMAYGYFDHEVKSQVNHMFFGLIFLQFQTFMSAKLNLWFKAPTNRGGNTAQGKYVEMVRNGETYYRRIITDESGNIIRTDIIPESLLTKEEKGVLLPQMEWLGDYVEGLFYSIGGMLHDICHLNWKGLAQDKQRLANVKLALHDLLIGIIVLTILKSLFTDGSNKMIDTNPAERILLKAMSDVSPDAITDFSLNPSFVQTWSNLKQNGMKLLFNDDYELANMMQKTFGAAKDFVWED